MRQVTELPADCRALIPSSVRGTYQSWQAFVPLEHCDRIKRLSRLSSALPPDQRPVFYEGIVPAARLPASFGVDIPVLRVVFPERSFFDTDEFELRPEAQEIVAIVAESLRKEPPDVTLFVAGHTDSRGNDDYNEALSIDRANSIATAIFAKGISLASIWRIGFGEDMPLYSGSTSYDFDRNRRVEFLFASKVEAVSDWLATQQSSGLCQGSSQRETDLCRQKLRFRQDYVAERISSSRPVQVSMSRAVKRGVIPESMRQTKVAPTALANRQVSPVSKERAQVLPEGSTRIRIDPVNHRSDKVRITL